MRSIRVFSTLVLTASAVAAGQGQAKRAIRVGDMYRLKNVGDAQVSPEGSWVAYTVSATDSAKDKSDTDIWMTSWDGSQTIQVTSSPDGESAPRFSPDGRYLSFLSSRQGGKGSQLWLLDRRGGEAKRVSELKTGIRSYEWSPDGKRMVLVMSEAPADNDTTNKKPKPIVLDRYHFKSDAGGYLDTTRAHLYLFDLDTRKAELLTPGRFEESSPDWSADGKWIVFESKRVEGDPDRSNNSDVFVVEARAGAAPRQLTTFDGPDGCPCAFSPDGSTIAYLRGSDPKFSAYNEERLAILPASGGTPRVLTDALDRPVSSPQFTADGKSIVFLFTDDRARYVGKVPASGGAVQKLTDGRLVIGSLSMTKDGKMAVLSSTATQPSEVFALENGSLRRLSHQNDAWLSEIQLATTEDVSFKAKDGNEAHGLLVKPVGYQAGTKVPLLLRIHGGPNGQDQHSFSLERELFAANGYAVLNVNYRGSNGRGEKYQQAIFADWGNKEVVDLLAGVDYVVSTGIADPERLGIGGWSYGGILTDYTTATTNRFKAAISGAGSALQLSMYGSDQYIYQYENELGPPWKTQDLWIKLSYPFFHADRITTPTLYMGGDKDFNVPVIGGEQMYQALRSLNVPTELVVYPNQHHGLSLPSFNYDRLTRYLAWYDKYLKGTPVQAGVVRP
ncbi:MAG TPA: S9 family peptidase [Gemmatimonadaceae bacterium]|nr:S9 family peptidase [Gemmatimonadaceae bacterium]